MLKDGTLEQHDRALGHPVLCSTCGAELLVTLNRRATGEIVDASVARCKCQDDALRESGETRDYEDGYSAGFDAASDATSRKAYDEGYEDGKVAGIALAQGGVE